MAFLPPGRDECAGHLPQPVSRLWWTKKRTYFLFVMRELSSIFVAWFAVFLMVMVLPSDVARPPTSAFLDWAASPIVVVVNIVALAFAVLHTMTWFVLTLQAMVVRLGGRRASGEDGYRRWPDRAGGDGGSRRWPSAGWNGDRVAVPGTHCGVGIHRLAGAPMTKRHVEPIVWLLFSGGGVIASVFLPILIVLLDWPFPWNGFGPTTTICTPSSAIGSPGWSCWACSSSCCFTGRTGSGSPCTTDSSSSWPRRSLCSAARRYSALRRAAHRLDTLTTTTSTPQSGSSSSSSSLMGAALGQWERRGSAR